MIGGRIGTIVGARIGGDGREMLPDDGAYDVFLSGGVITDIAPTGALPSRGEVLRADGGWLIPGLWDHHVHVVQWALVAMREPLGHAVSATHAARIMAEAPILADGRRVGTGYRDALWPDTPSLDVLDGVTGDVPTYMINSDVHSVWLNSAAMRREGHIPDGIGVLREEPAFEISRRLNLLDPTVSDTFVDTMVRQAATRGVVGLVDLDMAWNEGEWARRLARGIDAVRVEFGIYPAFLDRALAEGLRTGDLVRGADTDLVRVGPLKVISDGSLGTRTAACSHPYPGDPHDYGVLTIPPVVLTDLMTRATAGGLASAIHAIGDMAVSHALDAFAATGAWGSIEHAQLLAHADIPRFSRLGVAASVQPEHAVDDRDMTDRLWAEQTAIPYPLRSLRDSGANLRLGSDAPVSNLDPWAAMAAAVYRTRDGREPWRPEESIDAETALAASTHGGSTAGARIEVGSVADLALCAHDPLSSSEEQLRGMEIAATMLAGRVTHLQ
ncbi:amidohydrolase family protein [Microbacterium koreense]|uniref:Amidohydrolase family protein n=1 Tax=Microbacterium koreense TaxID=323761 RepID=A0ABW2ZS61_9MICO